MFDFANIPWNLILPLLVLQFILMLVALIDIVRHKRTNGPVIMWVLLIIFVNLVGPILYFVFGRRQS